MAITRSITKISLRSYRVLNACASLRRSAKLKAKSTTHIMPQSDLTLDARVSTILSAVRLLAR